MAEQEKKIVVAVSGGFDPIHPGHIRYFHDAKKLGDVLVVILNNDNWLLKKKGFVFMHDWERKEVIEAVDGVDKVVISSHSKNPKDMSVVAELKKIKPDIFANGGDRDKLDSSKKSSSLNLDRIYCVKNGIKMIFNVGSGGKVQSSSWLLSKHAERNQRK